MQSVIYATFLNYSESFNVDESELDPNAKNSMAPLKSHIKSSSAQRDCTPSFMCLSYVFLSLLIDMLAVHPCTLHFNVQNKPEEVPGISPKTTEHIHLSVPVQLRITRLREHARVYAIFKHTTFLGCYFNEMTKNLRSPSNWTL